MKRHVSLPGLHLAQAGSVLTNRVCGPELHVVFRIANGKVCTYVPGAALVWDFRLAGRVAYETNSSASNTNGMNAS